MPNQKRTVTTILLAGVVALLVWQFSHSSEWKHFTWAAVWTATRSARWEDIAGAVALIYLSYVIRVWRWQGLMSPPGRFGPIWRGTAIGFTGTSLLGRPAELVRPYYIARKHQSKLAPQLAVWLLERTFDMAGVVLLVALDLALSPRLSALTRQSAYQQAFHRAGMVLTVAIVVMVGGLYWFHLRSAGVLGLLHRRQQRHPHAWRQRLTHFLEMLAEGTAVLTKPRRLLAAVGWTVLLWLDVSGSIWLTVHAYPTMLPGFSFAAGVLLMGFTAVGAVLQLPAVGGGFQVLTVFGLTKFFGAALAPATSAALLTWLICFYAIAPVGLGLAAHEGVSWRGIEHEAIQTELAEEA